MEAALLKSGRKNYVCYLRKGGLGECDGSFCKGGDLLSTMDVAFLMKADDYCYYPSYGLLPSNYETAGLDT